MRVIEASRYRRMPWKNGGGETTEIAVHPPGAGLDAFDWRISMARIDSDGAFSLFPGIDRTLAVLTGEGLRLAVAGCRDVELLPGAEPWRFPGDVAAYGTRCRGSVTDLNVMTRRGRYQHRVTRREIRSDAFISFSAPLAFLLCPGAALTVRFEEQSASLEPCDALVVEGSAGSLRVSSHAETTVFLIEISAAAGSRTSLSP